jgi:hypothetical protein
MSSSRHYYVHIMQGRLKALFIGGGKGRNNEKLNIDLPALVLIRLVFQ